MPARPERDAAAPLAGLLLSAACLHSALRTFQVNRGPRPGSCSRPSGPSWKPPPDRAWPCAAVGLPLLAFGFHWPNGDRFTANALLGGALLLAGGRGCLTEEGRAAAARSVGSTVAAAAAAALLLLSVFPRSGSGVAGSLLLGAAGLLAGTGLWPLPAPGEADAVRCLTAAADLALALALALALGRALRAQHLQPGAGSAEWAAAAAAAAAP